jgi:hypothetical protein
MRTTKNEKQLNTKHVFTILGASNHTPEARALHDYYATDPIALTELLKYESFSNVWECACGEGHLSKVLMAHGIHSKSTDLINRAFGNSSIDFLSSSIISWNGDIITNPPYALAKEFVLQALSIIPKGRKVAMFLRLHFLESKSRASLFESHPPKTIYVSRSRICCYKNGNMSSSKSSAIAYCWMVWEKGYKGNPVVKWFN